MGMTMSFEEKTLRKLAWLESTGVPVLDELPAGWRFMGHYVGQYQWANNGKSRFGPGYEHALVRMGGDQ